MKITDLKYEEGIIVNSQDEWDQLIELMNKLKINENNIKNSFFSNPSTILYPYECETSDLKYAEEHGFPLFKFSDIQLIDEPYYEVY